MSLKPVGWLGQEADRHKHCYPTHVTIEASADVFADGFEVVRVGDAVAPHAGSCSEHKTPHGAKVQKGSASVFANGKPLAREGDLVRCDTGETAPLLQGRAKVLVGDASPVAQTKEAEALPDEPETILNSEEVSPRYGDGDVVAVNARSRALAILKQNNARGRGLGSIRPDEIAALLFKYRDSPEQKPGVPMARMSPEAEGTIGPPTDDPVSRFELQGIVRRVLASPDSTDREVFIAQRLEANYTPLSLLSQSGGGIDYVSLQAAARGGALKSTAPAPAAQPKPTPPAAQPKPSPSPSSSPESSNPSGGLTNPFVPSTPPASTERQTVTGGGESFKVDVTAAKEEVLKQQPNLQYTGFRLDPRQGVTILIFTKPDGRRTEYAASTSADGTLNIIHYGEE